MGDHQTSRHPSFRVNGGDVSIVIAQKTEQLLEQLPLDEREDAYDAMLWLGVERLVKRRGVTQWERVLGVLGLDVATADAGQYRVRMVYFARDAILELSLIPKNRSCSSHDSDDDDDDDHPPTGPGGGPRGGTFAERLSGDLQASADEREHEPCEIAAHRENVMFQSIKLKGGAGKTTVMLHLCLAAAERGLRAEVIDLDPMKNLSEWTKLREERPQGEVFSTSTLCADFDWRSQRVGLLKRVLDVLWAVVTLLVTTAIVPAVAYQIRLDGAASRRARLFAVRGRLASLYAEVELCRAGGPVPGAVGKLWKRIVPIFAEIAELARAYAPAKGRGNDGVVVFKQQRHMELLWSAGMLLARIEVILRRNTAAADWLDDDICFHEHGFGTLGIDARDDVDVLGCEYLQEHSVGMIGGACVKDLPGVRLGSISGGHVMQ